MPTAKPDLKQRKHRQIFEELLRAINSGQYGEGQRLPSEAELVQGFGASRPTVARALRDLEYKGLVVRRAGSGTYVRSADRSQARVFGLLIPGLGDTEIFEPICKGMATAAQRVSDDALLWGNAAFSAVAPEAEAERLCEHYVARQVSGVFFAPLELTSAMDEVNHRISAALERAGIPAVLLDRDLEKYPRRSRHDLIGIDNRRAGYTVTEHLLRQGCRRIVFVGRPHSAATVDARIAGYREALSCRDLVPSPDWVQRIDPDNRDAVRNVLAGIRPDGFVCANDFTAAHLMASLEALGKRIPDEIRLVGMDDVKYASLLRVPLTTVHQPCVELGMAAVSAMLERIARPGMPARDILLDFQLIVRGSCGSLEQTA
jgi:GntR family transcriptional regulator, arabinose operon transcriptional repressor